VTITSASSAADAITIHGDASAAETSATSGIQGVEVDTAMTVIRTTAGGGIAITGKTNAASAAATRADVTLRSASILSNSGPITVTGQTAQGIRFLGDATLGYKAGSSAAASTSDITLIADKVTLEATDRLQSSGALTVKPYTAATTIGLAGGAGTLSLPASAFSTNFTNGFSRITVGSAAAGDITVGSTALAYNDPLTLKTAGTSRPTAAPPSPGGRPDGAPHPLVGRGRQQRRLYFSLRRHRHRHQRRRHHLAAARIATATADRTASPRPRPPTAGSPSAGSTMRPPQEPRSNPTAETSS
jgi:hypothetical protein